MPYTSNHNETDFGCRMDDDDDGGGGGGGNRFCPMCEHKINNNQLERITMDEIFNLNDLGNRNNNNNNNNNDNNDDDDLKQ